MTASFPFSSPACWVATILVFAPAAAQGQNSYKGTRQPITYAGEILRACPSPESPSAVQGTLPANNKLTLFQGLVGCPSVDFYGTITVLHPMTISGTAAGGIFTPSATPAEMLDATFDGRAATAESGNESHDFWVDMKISEGLAAGETCKGSFPSAMVSQNGTGSDAILTEISCAFPKLAIVPGSQVMSNGRLVAFDALVKTNVVLDTGHGGFRCCDNRGGKYDVTFTSTYKFSLEGGEVSPLTLNFTAPAGGPRPGPQYADVRGFSTTPADFTTTVLGAGSGDPVPAWLSAGSKTGQTPALVAVLVDQAGLQPGGFSGRVRVAVGGQNVDVMVNLTVTAGTPMLEVAPRRLRFGGRSASPGLLEQPLLVSNAGGGAPLAFTATVVHASLWIRGVTPNAGQAAGEPTLLRVRVDTTGLAAGIYRDEIRIESDAGSFSVPVTLVVTEQGSLISVGNTGLRFATRQNQGSSQVQNVRVLNLGDTGTTVNWTANIGRGRDLVQLGQTTGTAMPGKPSDLTVSLAEGATATAGGQYALIVISDPQAQNSPQYVVVVVDVTANTPAVPILTGSLSAPRVRVDASSMQEVAFTAAASDAAGLGLFTVTPAAGTVSTFAPATIEASVAKTPPPGIYYGTITVAFGTQVRSATLVFIVPPGAAADAPGRAANGCTASKLGIVPGGIANNFSVPAGWPATLVAGLVDDCGEAVTVGNVVATFSNGDAPLALQSQGTGVYSATWQPGHTQPGTTVKLTGAFGTLPAATFEISGEVTENATAPPVLAPGGFLHNLNPQVGAPLAPGTVTQVYGDNLADVSQSAPVVPLPNVLNGVLAVVGPASAPLYFISKGQLTVQLPDQLTPNRTYAGLVTVGERFTLPEPVDIVAVQPGTVQFADGRLVAQHPDYSLVTAESPAKPGESLTVYLVGMGATDPSVAAGTAAPANPLAYATVKPAVTVAGQTAELSFWGLTPGGVGLYQINFAVPPNAPAGDLEVVITQGGVTANVTRLAVAP